MMVPDAQTPLFTIYNGNPQYGSLSTSGIRTPNAILVAQPKQLQPSTHQPVAGPMVITTRGTQMQQVHKVEGGPQMPATAYQLTANTYIHHK